MAQRRSASNPLVFLDIAIGSQEPGAHRPRLGSAR
jgi:hypothetical protein